MVVPMSILLNIISDRIMYKKKLLWNDNIENVNMNVQWMTFPNLLA